MSKPWNEGGKEDCLEVGQITMTHDDLVLALGPLAAKTIEDAGFVLVPRKWRAEVFAALLNRPAS